MLSQRYLEDFCTIFYEITNSPVHLYSGEECVLSVPQDPLSFVSHHLNALWQQPGISYDISETGLFFARVPVEKTEMSLVIGPFLLNFLSDELVLRIMNEYCIVAFPQEIVSDYLHSVASGVFSKAVSLVRLAVFSLTQHLPGMNDLFTETPKNLKEQISERHTKALVLTREEEQYHNTYNFERMVFGRLQAGDADFFLSAPRSSVYKVGKVADTSLRQEKNIFIIAVALATRAAIAGGLAEEVAYQLSDEYIQTVESMVSFDSVDHLTRSMLVDFAERVRDASLPLKDIPEDISRCIKYIRMHTNSNLSVQEVADAVNLSRSHLSRKFRKTMGFEISAFIMRCKLEEARSLLMYSNQSISEISNYLGFSSQSYFTNVFRKKYGLTPKEFRMQNKKKLTP